MKLPKDRRYTREHEWVQLDKQEATIGISDFAQHELGEVVFVELPELGAMVTKDEPFGVVESVKAASDVYAPVSGEVTAVNTELADRPESVNEDPYGDAWLIRVEMSAPEEADELMDVLAYEAYLREETDADPVIEDAD